MMKLRKGTAFLLATLFAFTIVGNPLIAENDDDDSEWGGGFEVERNTDGSTTAKAGVTNEDGTKLYVTKKSDSDPDPNVDNGGYGVEINVPWSRVKKVASGIVNTVSGWFGGGSGSESCSSDSCDTGCDCDPCSCGDDGGSCSSGSCDDGDDGD